MAKLRTAEVKLGQSEVNSLITSIEAATRAWARPRLALAREQTSFGLRYIKASDRELARCGANLRSVYAPIDDAQKRRYLSRFRREKRPRGPARRWITAKRPNLVTLNTGGPGTETVPLDFATTNHWEQGNVISNPSAGVGARFGGAAMGSIGLADAEIKHVTGFGPRLSAGSTAAFGSWAIPQPPAGGHFLSVRATPHSIQTVSAITLHYSSATALCALFFGLLPFNPATRQFGGFIGLDRFDLVSVNIWGTTLWNNSRQRSTGLYTSTTVDPRLWYAIILWLGAYVATQNAGGVNLEVSTDLASFDYDLL